jgi:hypothetical protein
LQHQEKEEIAIAIDFDDIENAFFYASMDGSFNNAIVDTESGEIYYTSELGDPDELPEDIYEDEKYVYVPDQRDLNLGKPLAIEFVSEFLPNELDKVYSIFSRKGAYSRYKDFLEKQGFIDEWYDFEDKRRKEVLKEWCKENNIKLKD